MADQYKLTRTYRKLVADTTINSSTLLSTDYLNHFNELVMLIDLIPDMPDMLEEAREWRPKTYAEHFRDSSFTHKDLAIAAYDQALDEDRDALERTVAVMNERAETGLSDIQTLLVQADEAKLRNTCGACSSELQEFIDSCSGIINGVEGAASAAMAKIDAGPIVPEADQETVSEEEAVVMDQSAIDALFD